jgi:hypothetical protein
VSNRFTRLVSAIAVVALVAAGCSSGGGTADPYELVASSSKVSWDPLQINVGFAVKDGDTSLSIEPSAIAFVIDAAGKKGGLHVALPTDKLGLPAGALGQLGITGNTIDFDMIYDGNALYGRSPFFGPTLRMLLPGDLPAGDLSGWLTFGTNAEFAALAALGGEFATPSAAPAASLDAATIRTSLAEAGVTLGLAGTEQRNGVDANHITVAIDSEKLLSNPDFAAGAAAANAAQIEQMRSALKAVTVTGDLWLDKASNRLAEADVHVVNKNDADEKADVTVTFRTPDGTVSLSTPPSSVALPFGKLMQNLMKLAGRGADS